MRAEVGQPPGPKLSAPKRTPSGKSHKPKHSESRRPPREVDSPPFSRLSISLRSFFRLCGMSQSRIKLASAATVAAPPNCLQAAGMQLRSTPKVKGESSHPGAH